MPRYLHAHPSDHGHEAAERLGKLLAQGLLGYVEIMAALAPRSPPEQMRLAWTLLDSASLWETRRDRTEREVARAIRPLIEAIAPSPTIVATARQTNARYGDALLHHEVQRIVVNAIDDKLAAMAAADRKRARGR